MVQCCEKIFRQNLITVDSYSCDCLIYCRRNSKKTGAANLLKSPVHGNKNCSSREDFQTSFFNGRICNAL